jgi:hypothetical protein
VRSTFDGCLIWRVAFPDEVWYTKCGGGVSVDGLSTACMLWLMIEALP